MSKVTPWWRAMRLRQEVISGAGTIDDVQMSLYGAVHGVGATSKPYSDPKYYGEITFPSYNLVDLLAKVAVRLAAPGERYRSVEALYHLDQAMGGGKSHALIGLWHLAQHPTRFAQTEVGERVFAHANQLSGVPLSSDLSGPKVVLVSCDNMTPGIADKEIDGPAKTLYERFLWRLFDGDYNLYRRYQDKSDKAGVTDAITAVNKPVVILVDEVLDYLRQLSTSENKDLGIKDMAFLRSLLDVVNDVPHVAMVVVMIKSEVDAMALDPDAQAKRIELESLLIRNGTTATVTSPTDFTEIIQRRLFEAPAPQEVVEGTAADYEALMKGLWEAKVFSALPQMRQSEFRSDVERSFPFHPALMRIAENEWAPVSGFQKVRSTIRIFAASVYGLVQRSQSNEWVPLLIGPGDLPLSMAEVRESLIGSGLIADPKTEANYRQVAANDIVGDDDRSGTARRLDLARAESGAAWIKANPRAAERMATALFLFSIVGQRGQGRQGATEAELKAASFSPDATYGLADADGVLLELTESDQGLAALEKQPGRGGQPARYFLSTRQTLTMIHRAQRAAVSDADRDEEMAQAAFRVAKTGPFRDKIVVEVPGDDPRSLRDVLKTASIDDARKTRLVILDPRRFVFYNGADKEARDAIRAAVGIGDDKLPVQWASSAVFAVINTDRRRTARVQAAEYLAWRRVADVEAVRNDLDLSTKAQEERDEAKKQLELAVRKAFQHIVYVRVGEGGQGRAEREVRLEQENQSALDGGIVWQILVGEGKAFNLGEFDAKALLHNLTNDDYGRPLDELRDAFWNSPRLPLLPDGEEDLKRAIFQAITGQQIEVVDDQGSPREVLGPGEIALNQSSLRLRRFQPAASTEEAEAEEDAEKGKAQLIATTDSDVILGFTVRTSLGGKDKAYTVMNALMALANEVDSTASHIDIVVKVTLPKTKADNLSEKVKATGALPTVTEL